MRAYVVFALAALTAFDATAAERESGLRERYLKATPCPAEHVKNGRCEMDVDHLNPLCAGGSNDFDNLQLLTPEAHAVKTRHDVAYCAVLRQIRAVVYGKQP